MLRLLVLMICLLSCQTAADFVYSGAKLKGVNLVAPPKNQMSRVCSLSKRLVANGWLLSPTGFAERERLIFTTLAIEKSKGGAVSGGVKHRMALPERLIWPGNTG